MVAATFAVYRNAEVVFVGRFFGNAQSSLVYRAIGLVKAYVHQKITDAPM